MSVDVGTGGAGPGAPGPEATLTSTDPVLAAFAEEVGTEGPVAVEGGRTRWDLGGTLSDGTRLVTAPSGIVEYAPNEMTVTVRAGTTMAELNLALAERGQRTALPDRGGTVGGAVVVGENDVRSLGRGLARTSLLQVRYISAEGRIISSGGPTVKNVSGFDLPRLIVGSLGTLGLVAEVILRTNPIPPTSRWLAASGADPVEVHAALLAPSAVLWDGSTTWVELEGHLADVEAEQDRLCRLAAFTEVPDTEVPDTEVPDTEVPDTEVTVAVHSDPGVPAAGGAVDHAGGAGLPVDLPRHRWSLSPAEVAGLGTTAEQRGMGRFVAAVGLGLVFADSPQPPRSPAPELAVVARRLKDNFDPTGRLNPGRDPGRK